jgi:hypothetical protein
MDRTRDHFLARAGFSRDKDRGIAGSDLFGLLQHLADSITGEYDIEAEVLAFFVGCLHVRAAES